MLVTLPNIYLEILPHWGQNTKWRNSYTNPFLFTFCELNFTPHKVTLYGLNLTLHKITSPGLNIIFYKVTWGTIYEPPKGLFIPWYYWWLVELPYCFKEGFSLIVWGIISMWDAEDNFMWGDIQPMGGQIEHRETWNIKEWISTLVAHHLM